MGPIQNHMKWRERTGLLRNDLPRWMHCGEPFTGGAVVVSSCTGCTARLHTYHSYLSVKDSMVACDMVLGRKFSLINKMEKQHIPEDRE